MVASKKLQNNGKSLEPPIQLNFNNYKVIKIGKTAKETVNMNVTRMGPKILEKTVKNAY